jgi:DNA-binding NarL/FixJ family response regulator
MGGIPATKIIKEQHPELKILMYSGNEDNNVVSDAIKAGADGYLFKSDNTHELFLAIDTVISGGNFMSQRISRSIIPFLISQSRRNQHVLDNCEISGRENEILCLVLEGYSSKDIGKLLRISTRTVETHRYNIMKKLRCSNVAELFKCAIDRKWV